LPDQKQAKVAVLKGTQTVRKFHEANLGQESLENISILGVQTDGKLRRSGETGA
jgi:hypothetical protein